MPDVHLLKVHKSVFYAIESGLKSFEFRKNDRDYKAGDLLVLKYYDPETSECNLTLLYPTEIYRRVSYIIYGPQFGIPEGYCIMSIV